MPIERRKMFQVPLREEAKLSIQLTEQPLGPGSANITARSACRVSFACSEWGLTAQALASVLLSPVQKERLQMVLQVDECIEVICGDWNTGNVLE